MHTSKKVTEIIQSDDFSKSFLLEYFVTQKQADDEKPQLFFGIEIAKHTLKDGVRELEEVEHSGFFSQNQALVTDTAIMLADNSVTPATLCYILDDNIL